MELDRGATEDHHFGGTFTSALVAHLRKAIGAQGLTDVLRQAGETRSLDVLSDTASWSSYAQFRGLLSEAAKVLGGPEAMTDVGRQLFDLSDFDRSPAAVHALGSPEALYANADAAIGMVCPIMRSEPYEVSQREWLITQTFVTGFEPFAEHCALQVGIQQFTTMIFGYPPADVVEEQCACLGAPACVYRVRWDPVDEVERRADFLESRVHTLEALLEQFESTVADLVSGPDLQSVISRTFESATRAVQAPIFVLSLHKIPPDIQDLYSTGVSPQVARVIAQDFSASKPTDESERIVIEVASTRNSFGWLAAIRPAAGFLPKEPQRLQAYARFLAAALDSADAVAEARRQQQDASRQRDTARALLTLSTALAEVTSVQEMAAKLVRAVPAVMGCDRAVVLLTDGPHSGHARFAATFGYSPAAERRLRRQKIAVPAHRPGEAAFNRRPIDTADDLPATKLLELGTAANTVIPIIVDGEWAGAIVASVVRDPDRLAPSRENGDRLRALAAQAATAIRNAQLLDQVRHQALHDPLTGLPNRALIMDRVDQMLARARRNKQACAALFIDLDGFKNVNDTFGHGVGDELLRAVTARLTATLRPSDTVGRLGGDEFVVLVDGSSLDAGPELVADRLLTVLREPFQLAGSRTAALPITASIGIATGDRRNAGELLRDADVALYQAKAAGKDCFRVFEPEMQATIHNRLLLQMDLQQALQKGQFALVYQPVCQLATGEITSVEALLRWNHPIHGQIQPGEFIPLLEESGLILDVGRWVLVQACQQAARWQHEGRTLDVAVNVSGRQLLTDRLLADIQDSLTASGLDSSRLILEITESTMMVDVEATATRLRAVRSLGVRIAIDDFGTGYSSLAVLRDFPADCLKIDRGFIAALSDADDSAALIQTFVQLGNTLGLTIIAEGIETTEQYRKLQSHGCHSGQGFLISRPMDAKELEANPLLNAARFHTSEMEAGGRYRGGARHGGSRTRQR